MGRGRPREVPLAMTRKMRKWIEDFKAQWTGRPYSQSKPEEWAKALVRFLKKEFPSVTLVNVMESIRLDPWITDEGESSDTDEERSPAKKPKSTGPLKHSVRTASLSADRRNIRRRDSSSSDSDDDKDADFRPTLAVKQSSISSISGTSERRTSTRSSTQRSDTSLSSGPSITDHRNSQPSSAAGAQAQGTLETPEEEVPNAPKRKEGNPPKKPRTDLPAGNERQCVNGSEPSEPMDLSRPSAPPEPISGPSNLANRQVNVQTVEINSNSSDSNQKLDRGRLPMKNDTGPSAGGPQADPAIIQGPGQPSTRSSGTGATDDVTAPGTNGGTIGGITIRPDEGHDLTDDPDVLWLEDVQVNVSSLGVNLAGNVGNENENGSITGGNVTSRAGSVDNPSTSFINPLISIPRPNVVNPPINNPNASVSNPGGNIPTANNPSGSKPNVNVNLSNAGAGNPTTNVSNPSTCLSNSATLVNNPIVNVNNPTTNVNNPTTNVNNPTSNVNNPTTNVNNPTTNVNNPNGHNPTTNNPTANANDPNGNNPTTDNPTNKVRNWDRVPEPHEPEFLDYLEDVSITEEDLDRVRRRLEIREDPVNDHNLSAYSALSGSTAVSVSGVPETDGAANPVDGDDCPIPIERMKETLSTDEELRIIRWMRGRVSSFFESLANMGEDFDPVLVPLGEIREFIRRGYFSRMVPFELRYRQARARFLNSQGLALITPRQPEGSAPENTNNNNTSSSNDSVVKEEREEENT